MVDSVEELKSSRSVSGKNFPNFELLDAKIPSALNKIIPNSHFKKKVSLEEQKAQKVLMIQFLITLIYSLTPFVMTMSKTSIRDGTKFCCQ